MTREEIDSHLAMFAQSFLLPDRRDRWAELLVRRRTNVSRNSHKLHSALDRKYCDRVDTLPAPAFDRMGVFYDFFDEPVVVSCSAAIKAGAGCDAVFSLDPGKLAVFFFHEGETWLCKR